MKKILVVFTGGTIGSKVSNKTIDVDENIGYLLIEKFKELSDLEVEFETIQPLNILSENCTPNDWAIMIAAMKSIDMNSLDGIVITHGTDTLPYTSAIISYVFANTKIPIILTASNYALDQPKSNGIRNFISSIEFICNCALPGIFTIFEDRKGIKKVYLGTRIVEANPFNDQFTSFGGEDFGYLKDGRLIKNENPINPVIVKSEIQEGALLNENIDFKNNILAIRPYPGLNYTYFRFDESNKPSAIIHSLYHSSTACIIEGKVSLPEFIKYCNGLGIDFYLASFKNTEEDLYITSKELLGNGAFPLQNISMEAAISKLWLAYNINVESPKDYVMNNMYYEFIHVK